ncbi:MAG TPA: 5-deoxy-glucuronate isomerase [Patescibacteria group bacterium]|nr:5-deoxy-glucuronate isomerase [Patescibacteria group bacterium]
MTESPATLDGLYIPAGTGAADGWSLVITPETAGWQYAGLRIAELAPGGSIAHATGEDEAIVLPLAGSARVTCDGQVVELAGRDSVLSGPTDFAYLPRDASVVIESDPGGRIALATARAERRLGFRRRTAADVPIELRGAGACSRAVRNFAAASAFEAERLIAVEVVTPGGNWSSYPPHKHDEDRPTEAILEEIYYYEIAAGPGGPGVGYQRAYGSPGRPLDLLVEVRDRDAVLIPHGWHGPSMAVPGYDMYYLNVMAGPGPERAWRITDDPAHAWVRDTWATQAVDPRLAAAPPDPPS